jgi:ubiquinone/menaquinone biosynthesis C-methylase UbiE
MELGCGNAFQSVLLASLFRELIATDLFNNNDYHKIEIRQAKRLIYSLNAKNVRLISCSATDLPFTSSYFDFVFSSSVTALKYLSYLIGIIAVKNNRI